MSYSQHLGQLPLPRLREIATRRAGTLRGIPRISDRRSLVSFLAEALSRRESVHAALYQTDLLQMRVLTYAIVNGGSASFEALVAASGEEARPRLLRAVDALEGLGLAFWHQAGDDTSDVWVPPSVCQHTPLPLPMRYRVRAVLAQYDKDTLANIAETLNVQHRAGAARGSLADAIAQHLSQPETVPAVIAALSPAARDIFAAVIARGGVTSVYELGGMLEPRQRNQLYHYEWAQRWGQGKPRNPAEELLIRCLLAPAGQVGWGYGDMVVPGEVLERATGASLFNRAAPPLPQWDTIPAGDAVLARHDTLCRDVTYLFGYLGRAEAARTSKGNIHRSALKAIAKGLSVPTPEYAAFVYASSRSAELINVQGRGNQYNVTTQGMGWLEADQEEQLRSLYDAWRVQTTWCETLGDPLADPDNPAYSRDPRAYRPLALKLLADLAKERPDELASLDSLLQTARYRWWTRFSGPYGVSPDEPVGDDDEDDDEDGPDYAGEEDVSMDDFRLLRRLCCECLFWLGLTECRRDANGLPTHVRLTPRGRRVAEGLPPEETDGATTDTFILQPNMEIYAPPNLAPKVLYRLFRITEPGSSGMLALSRDMLRRALDRGETAPDLLKFLKKHSQTGVPQNVEYLIKEVGGRHGHIKVGQAGLYVQVSDPVLLKELQAQKGLKISFRGQLADTVALITGDSIDAVLKQLRQAGYFPISADEHEKTPAPVSPAPTRRRAAAVPEAPPKSEIDTRVNWDALEKERDGLSELEQDAGRAADIRAVLEQAIAEERCVEIVYRPKPEGGPWRMIEPYDLNGWSLSAYCRVQKDMRAFLVHHIADARLTDERFRAK